MYDLNRAEDELNYEVEVIQNCEWEGDDVLRFDIGDNSFWVYESGDIDNLTTFPKGVQATVRKALKKALV